MRVLRHFRSKVARRVFLLFLACALTPFLVLAAVAFFEFRDRLFEPYLEQFQQATKTGGMSIAARLADADDRLRAVASQLALSGEELDDAVESLGTAATGTFRSLAVATPEGGLLQGHGWDGGPLLLDPSRMDRLAAGGTAVTVRAASDGTRRVCMVRLLRAADGAAVLVAGELRAERLWSAQELSGLSSYAVVDREGGLYSAELELPESILGELRAGGAASGTTEWTTDDGRSQVGCFWTLHLVPEYGIRWTLLCARPKAELRQPLRLSMVVLGLGMVLASLTSTLLGLHMLRRRLEPIERLKEAALGVAASDFATRVQIETGDELEELGELFNFMIERIELRTRELELANRAKNAFLAKVSHEIRTPMFAILGHAEECRQPEIPRAELCANLDVVRENGKHLMAIIADLLDVSSIEAGRLKVQRQECSLHEIVAAVETTLRPMAREAGLELRVDIARNVPRAVYTDPGRLRQIFHNLLGNAIKFTSEGHVRLDVRRGPPGPLGHDLVTLAVEDTGPGIADDQLMSIFDPFFQVDASSSHPLGGIGIGLSVSRNLARGLGGDITVESTPGRGSTFTATIDPGPYAALPPPLPATGAGPEASGTEDEVGTTVPAGLRVLLAEDNPVNRRLVTVMLERSGIDVDPAEDGLVACLKVKQALDAGRAYDVLLMDVQMPKLSGLEATRRLRAEGYEGPIVALTAHAMAPERERCLAAGCSDFATKPIEAAALLSVVCRNAAPRVGP